MDLKKKVEFECRECGSHELGYQKYVKCVTPASIKEDSQMEYGLSEIDEDDYLSADNCFVCRVCNGPVEHCGCRFEIEKDLLDYLTMDPVVRDKDQQEYEENLAAMAKAQDELDNASPEMVDELFDLI